MDESRQHRTCYSDITTHHLSRYVFAATKVSGRVLDAACGIGYGSALLKVNAPVVFGVDIDVEAIRGANLFFPGPTYVHGDIASVGKDLGKFDSIVSLETIEHLQDPAPVLRLFRRLCAGKFIVSVPNEENYKFEPKDFEGDLYPHHRHYTPAEFDELLTGHHFKVEERYCQRSKMKTDVVEGTDGKFLIYVCS